MVASNKEVVSFLRERDQKEAEQKKIYSSQIKRLDIFIGSPSRYPAMIEKLRTLATEIERLYATGRGMDDRDIVSAAGMRFNDARAWFAEQDPRKTIRKSGVPSMKYHNWGE